MLHFPERNSIRTRLVFWNTLVLALLFVSMEVVLHYSVRALLMQSVDKELYRRTQNIVDFPPRRLTDEGPEPRLERRPRMALADPKNPPGPADYRPRLINPQGMVMKPPDATEPWDKVAFGLALKGKTTFSNQVNAGEPLRIISRRFPGEGDTMGVVQDAYSLAANEGVVNTLDKALLLIFPFTLLFAALGSALVTSRMLGQVKSFTESANRITEHDLSQRLPVNGHDEFSTLARTFNGVIGRLQAAFQKQEDLIENLRQIVEQQRRFTSDASHELQTPLTAIKANTSLYLSASREQEPDVTTDENRAVLEDIDQAATAMKYLVEDLLLLARSDEGQLGQNRRVLVLQETIENAVALAATGKQGIATIQMKTASQSLELYANESEITRLFTNLLSNAIRYTPENGHIVIRCEHFDGEAYVTVADTGIGIAPGILPHLGERFFRADTARTRAAGGTGLGLSICKSIVASHGGRLTVESRLGEGTTVTVRLPLAKEIAQNSAV